MKNRKMLDIMGLADEKYVSEADPLTKRITPRSKFKWSTLLAAAACFLLILNLAITVPLLLNRDEENTPSTGQSGSVQDPNRDDGLIHLPTGSQKPSGGSDSGTNSSQAQGSNNHLQNPDIDNGGEDEVEKEENPPLDLQFLKNPALFEALDIFKDQELEDLKEEIQDALENETAGKDQAQGTDINDNQVQGISEGDIAKRSDKYLFYLTGTKLYVYSINKKNSHVECIFPLDIFVTKIENVYNSAYNIYDELEKLDEELAHTYGWEMYLTSDCKTLHLVMEHPSYPMTGVLSLDVSSAPSVGVTDFKVFSGKYLSSRMVNGELLLFTSFVVNRKYDKENPLSYIPYYTSGEKQYFSNDIYFPQELSSRHYVTVSRIDGHGLKVKESASFLSYSENIYVSKNNIFLTRQLRVKNGNELLEFWGARTPYDTEIIAIGYTDDKFTVSDTVKVRGYIKDQYSLDEYEGILRVATTSYMLEPGKETTSTASLFCIDISTMEIVSSVECFAPENEVVRSVRFDGTSGYICTSYKEVLIDPVFFFDLSDIHNITYKDTGEIDGYSSSLIDIGGGYVVGIGYGKSTQTLKIEAYKKGENGVETVCYEEYPSTRFATNYKAYYIDRKNHLIGIPISTYSQETYSYVDEYLLLYFGGTHFSTVMCGSFDHGLINATRGFYQNNFYYIISKNSYSVYDVGAFDTLPFTNADGTQNIPQPSTGGSTSSGSDIDEDIIPPRDPNAPAWP